MSYTEAFLKFLEDLPDGAIYLLLGLSALVENLFPPIPGDTITAFGAFLVGIGRLDFWGVYAATTLGSLTGFLMLFWIGRRLGRRFFLERDHRFFRAEDIRKAEVWFQKYGCLLIAANRFLPGVRSVISIAGGISRLEAIQVGVLAFLSCGLWNGIWIMMGYLLGSNWQVVQAKISFILVRYNLAVVLVAAVILFFLWCRKKRGKVGKNSHP
ncbi:MAG: DedA family protein [Deltaproteobacteria bacterium]|nr:DedA family protein [Deltaproteobacteria bacterium]